MRFICKIVHFNTSILYNLTMQKCTTLHYKAVHSCQASVERKGNVRILGAGRKADAAGKQSVCAGNQNINGLQCMLLSSGMDRLQE